MANYNIILSTHSRDEIANARFSLLKHINVMKLEDIFSGEVSQNINE